MLRILDCVEKTPVAPGASDVPRRTGPGAGRAPWIIHTGLRCRDLLNDDDVLPDVAEIVLVCELRFFPLDEFRESIFLLVINVVVEIVVPHSEMLTINLKHAEVAVGPARRRLDHQVKVIDAGFVRHLNTPPDCRPGVANLDLQVIDGFRWRARPLCHGDSSRCTPSARHDPK